MVNKLSLLRNMIIHDERQRSVGSEVKAETNGWTDGRTDKRAEAIALPPMLMWSVKTACGLGWALETMCEMEGPDPPG